MLESLYLHGYNVDYFPQILLVTLLYSFPLGYGVTRIYWREKNILSTLLLALGMGLPTTATLWSLMVWLTIPLNITVFLGTALIGSICLLFISTKVNHPIRKEKKSRQEIYTHFALVCIFSIVSYFLVTLPLINLKTPPMFDGQLHGFIQMIFKYTRIYHPLQIYPAHQALPNFYPPGFHVICTINSLLTGIGLGKTLMGTAATIYLVLCLFFFEVLYSLTSRLWVASIGVFLLFCRGMMVNLLLQSQYPELLAITACVSFFLVFSRMLEEKDRKDTLLAGVLLGSVGLIHTRFFFWLSVTLLVYIISRYLAKPGPSLQDQGHLCLVLLLGFLINIPQFLINAQKLTLTSQVIYSHYLLSIKDHLIMYQGWLVSILTFVTIIIFIIKRDRKSIFLVSWILVIFLNVDYWRILKLLSPSWFRITPYVSPVRGVWSIYTDIFAAGDPLSAILYGLLPVAPLAIAWGVYAIVKTDCLSRFIGKWKKNYFSPLVLSFIFGIAFVYHETKHIRPLSNVLSDADIQVLEALKENSRFDDVFLFNPPYMPSYWAPVIAERRSVLFNNTELFSYQNPLYPQQKMKEIYLNIGKHYQFLKENRISHIYVPGPFKSAFEHGGIPDFLELEFSAKDAAIYRVR